MYLCISAFIYLILSHFLSSKDVFAPSIKIPFFNYGSQTALDQVKVEMQLKVKDPEAF